MTHFQFDDGGRFVEVQALSTALEDGQRIRIRDTARALTMTRRVVENITVQECPDILEEYWHREQEAIEAIRAYRPELAAQIDAAYEEHRAALEHSRAY